MNLQYCAVAYLRTTKSDGTCTVSLTSAKTKVSPLKWVTLHRMELLGALIGAKVGNYLSNVKWHFWTDSMIIIHWIKSTSKQWKPFVANRIAEIQSLTLLENWRHCKGKENPADHGTQGLNAEKLAVDKLWWNGPSWLHSADVTSTEETNASTDWWVCCSKSDKRKWRGCLFCNWAHSKTENYSNLNKLLRVTARVRRFVHNFWLKQQKKYWIRLTQMKSSNLSKLWVKRSHNDIMHSGPQDTLIQDRERYRLVRGRQITKKMLEKCRKNKVKAGQQPFAPLPCDRITEAQPVEVVGVDFCWSLTS